MIMKKILFLPFLLAVFLCQGQSLCLQPMCQAVKAKVGDTAQLAAALTTVKPFQSIAFTQLSGPNTATLTPLQPVFTTSLSATQWVNITNMTAGTYLFQVTGKDNGGGIVTAIDSLIVSPATTCPVIPPARTAVSIQITINGSLITIPLAGTKITYSDGTTQ